MKRQRNKSATTFNGDEFRAVLSAMMRNQRGTHSETLSDPWRQNPFVRSGVSALYRIVKGVPIRALTGTKGGDDEGTEVDSTHPLAMLLAKPGPGLYGSELWAQVVAYKKLDGHSFVACYGASGWWTPEGRDWPREMQALNTRAVRFEESDIDAVTGAVRQWRVKTRRGMDIIVPAESMMHFRDFDPRDPIGCSSPLDPVWAGMEADLNVDAYAKAWLDNIGAVGAHLKSKFNLSESEQNAVLRAFKDAFGGAGKAGSTFLSGPDIDLVQGGAQTAKDMEMPALRAWNRDVVKAVLAVTDFEVGRVADYNRANSESARSWLWQNTILPELESIEAQFWGQVAEPLSRNERADTWVEFDTDNVQALKGDLAVTATTAAALINAGYDPVQVSEKLDLGLDYVEVATPDVPVDPAADPNAATANAVGAQQGLNGAQISAVLEVLASVSAGTLKPEAAIVMLTLLTIPEGTARRIVAGALDAPKPEPSAPVPPPADKSYAPSMTKRVGLSSRVAVRLHRAWQRQAEKTVGAKWRKFTDARYAETIAATRALNALAKPSSAMVDDLLKAPSVWQAGAREAIGETFVRLGTPLAENLGAELGGFKVLKVDDALWKAQASARVGQMVRVSTALRTRIRSSVIKAMTEATSADGGFTVADLEGVLQSRFKNILPSNAAVVARTESAMFANDVRQNLMRADGVNQKRWLATNDQWTRESHRELDGVTVGIDERFPNGLLYPCESGGPAEEVIQCRCHSMPWIGDDDG